MPRLSFLLLITLLHNTLAAHAYERYRTLSDTTVHSSFLGYNKNLSITVPIEYQNDDPQKSYPLVIVFDRQNERSYEYILNTIDYLTSNEQMPSCIIVGVESSMETRYQETQLEISDASAFGSKNENFIFNELIPLARKNYHASNFNMLIGHSRYGYFTSYLLGKHFSDLNAVISLSPFMEQKNVNLTDSIAALSASYSLNKNIYFRYGIGNDYPDDYEKLNEKLNSIKSNNSNIDFKGVLFPEADHNVTPGLTIAKAMYEVFEYWSQQQNVYIQNDMKDINTLPVLTNNIKDHYGSSLRPSLGTLNGKGWQFFSESEFTSAIQAWKIMLQEYPSYSEGYLAIIEAQKELKQDYSQTIIELKKSFATSEFYTAEERIDLQIEIDKLEKE